MARTEEHTPLRDLLTTPRDPGDPEEIRFVRQQAEFFHAMDDTGLGAIRDATLYLSPACPFCAATEDRLVYDPCDLKFTCGVCRRASPSTSIVAGRLARR